MMTLVLFIKFMSAGRGLKSTEYVHSSALMGLSY